MTPAERQAAREAQQAIYSSRLDQLARQRRQSHVRVMVAAAVLAGVCILLLILIAANGGAPK